MRTKSKLITENRGMEIKWRGHEVTNQSQPYVIASNIIIGRIIIHLQRLVIVLKRNKFHQQKKNPHQCQNAQHTKPTQNPTWLHTDKKCTSKRKKMREILVSNNHLRFSWGRGEIEINKGFSVGLRLIGARQSSVPIVPHRTATATEREVEEGGSFRESWLYAGLESTD